jgi:hypothetical protein
MESVRGRDGRSQNRRALRAATPLRAAVLALAMASVSACGSATATPSATTNPAFSSSPSAAFPNSASSTVLPSSSATFLTSAGATLSPKASPTLPPAANSTLPTSPSPTHPASPSPTSSPTAAPSAPASSGWSLVWNDQFNSWNPGKYFVYPQGWPDTTGEGVQTPSIISASGGNLLVHIQTVNGVHEVAAFCPALPGSLSSTRNGNHGDLLGMRYSFSIRADAMAGYKGVPLLWPLSETWPRDGEIDAPESDFMARPAAFVHHQKGTGPNDEDYFATPSGTSWQAWHTYTVEWVPGVRVDGWIDGVHWIHDTTRIPNTPMHLVMQFETSTDGVVPANSTQGYVQIAWLQVWKYVP